MEAAGALADVRVIDLAGEAGVFATRILADLGADVIRVEPPDGGGVRTMRPFLDDEPGPERSLYHLYHNANKRSVTLDLTDPRGAEVFRRLAASADVLVETGKPGELAELGLAYEQLHEANAGLIYVSITPFGQRGPWIEWSSNDLVAGAAGGLLYISGTTDDPPAQGGGDPAYKMASLAAATGVLFALVGRDADGVGAQLDISIQEAVVMSTLQTSNPNIYALDGRIPARRGLGMVYECADGGWVGLNPRPDRFGRLLDWFRDEEIETDLSESDWDLARGVGYGSELGIRDLIAEVAAAHPRDEVVRRAHTFGQLCLPVLRIEEMGEQEHFQVNHQFLEVEHDLLDRSLGFVRSPVDAMDGEIAIRRAPLLGEHNTEIYAELGLAERELSELHAEGVI